MQKQIKGMPLGEYPPIMDGDRVIYRTPPEYLDRASNQLILLGRGAAPDMFVLTFCTWTKDSRYKDPRGTWSMNEVNLSKKKLHALQRMDFGGL